MLVNDPGSGKTKRHFLEMLFIAEIDGDIIWTVTIYDDDVDIDEAEAKTVVKNRSKDNNRADDEKKRTAMTKRMCIIMMTTISGRN